VFVITEKGDEISRYVHEKINRTTTMLSAEGTYSKTNKAVLLCVVNKKEVPNLKKQIFEIDNRAFTIVTTVSEAIRRRV